MGFFLISLIGIPFTGGFFGKFYVFSAAIHSGFVWLAVIGLINSGIAAYYYLRVLAALYTKPAETSPVLAVPRASFALLLALLITISATLILGIVPGRILAQAKAGAATFSITAPIPEAAPVTSAAR
jgi:NADH-quinone oxidoreductase subunit N